MNAPALSEHVRILQPRHGLATPGFMKAVAASLLLHAAPIVYFAQTASYAPIISAGEESIEIELVVADSEPSTVTEAETPPKIQEPEKMEMASAAIDATDVKPEQEKQEDIKNIVDLMPNIPPVPDPVRVDIEKQDAAVTAEAPPVTAGGEQQAQINPSFAAKVARHLSRFKRFPSQARGSAMQAQVLVTFEIAANGTVHMARLDRTSGSSAIDAEAIAMIWRAAPFPQPVHARAGTVQFTIPVTYKVR